MADQYSFDVVSEVDLQEVDNAVNQAMKEISQRYDFKGSISKITLNKTTKELELVSDDDSRLKAVVDVLKGKLIKRNISPKAMDFQKAEAAFSGTVNQKVKIISGMPMDACKDIVKRIKDSKLKVRVGHAQPAPGPDRRLCCPLRARRARQDATSTSRTPVSSCRWTPSASAHGGPKEGVVWQYTAIERRELLLLGRAARHAAQPGRALRQCLGQARGGRTCRLRLAPRARDHRQRKRVSQPRLR